MNNGRGAVAAPRLLQHQSNANSLQIGVMIPTLAKL